MYSASVSIICHHTNTRDGTKASTNSTSGLILLLFLDGQAECVQTYMCVCITNLSSYWVSALILPWNSSVCLCPIASYAHAHAQLPIPKTTDSPAADLGPLLVPPAASLGRCVPSQSQGHSACLLASPAWYCVWLHLDLQKLTPCFAGTTDSPALVTCGLTPCLVGTHRHQAEGQDRIAKGGQTDRRGRA